MARIAGRQHGVVSRRDLLQAGFSPSAIDQRVRDGRLLVEFRAVYRVGHRAPSVEARYLAAVKACGDGALLYGLAAAHLYSLIKGAPPAPEVSCRTKRTVRGVKTSRARVRGTRFRGIPVATVRAALAALAAELTVEELARACHEAGVRYRTTPRQVEAVLPRNAPGAHNLRRVLRGDERVTLSELERRFLRLLRKAGLPLPETNRVAGGRRVDCRWPEHRLTVELLSYTYHGSRHAWEVDHRRAREAYRRGDEFRAYTYGDVFEDPGLMLAELQRLL